MVSTSLNVGFSTSSGPTIGAPTAYHNGNKKDETTHSAIENGAITVRNKDTQKQKVTELSRDTAKANNTLSEIFNKEKEQERMDTLDMVKDVAAQAKSIGTKIDRLNAQQEVGKKGVSEKVTNAAKDALGANATKEQIDALAYSNAVDAAVIDATKNGKNIAGIGSGFNQAIDAATSITTGVITGNIAGGLAGASAPYLATVIKHATGHYDAEKGEWKVDDKTGNYVLHGMLGGGVAALQGNSALAGAVGAAGGEFVAHEIVNNFYDGKDTKDLTESEKENLSNWSQVVSGVTVGAASGGNIGDAGAAISASKNAVENNFFFVPAIPVAIAASEAIGTCFATGPCTAAVAGVVTGAVGYELLQSSGETNNNYTIIGDGESLPSFKSKESADNKTSTKVASSSTSSGGAPLPPDDDDDKDQSNVSKNKDKQQQSNDFVSYKGKLEKGDKIDLEKFTKRITVSKSKGEYVDPKTGWRISPERSSSNPHGGSVWKLMDKAGNKIGTLSDKGVFLR